jgi:ElaA protein
MLSSDSTGSLQWKYLDFEKLSLQELYAVLALRQEVFIVEQACAYPDIDGYDQKASHLLGFRQDGLLAAYCRIFIPGVKAQQGVIGRVVTSPLCRREGFGLELMKRAIFILESQYPGAGIHIGAQLYLKRFYEGLGFVQSGEGYDEDGIPHIPMIKA